MVKIISDIIKESDTVSKKKEVRLMFFSGFYESIHDGVLDSECEWIMEDYGKKWDDFRFTYNYQEYCKNYVRAISSETGLDLEFKSMWSPREYNFATDEITCYISAKDLKKISSVLDSDVLEKIIKRRFTSRSGFISFYSNSLEEWKEKPVKDWDEIELGTLLDAWLYVNEFLSDENNSDLDYVGYEYCSGNGQYVEYEKLWDEQAELETAELHKKELEKLAIWTKSVIG